MNKKLLLSFIGGILVLALLIGGFFWYRSYQATKVFNEKLKTLQTQTEAQFQKNNPELYESLKKELSDSQEQIKKDPNDYNAYVSLGVAANALGQYQLAIDSYTKATQLRPVGSLPWNNLAQIYITLEDYSKAEEMYINYIKNLPGDTDAYLGLARLYMGGKIGNADEAKKVLEQGAKVVAQRQGLDEAIARINSGQLP